MNKLALKEKIIRKQNGKCAITDERLPKHLELTDANRKTPKRKGGILIEKNTDVVNPRARMKKDGILKDRSPEFDALKTLMDAREQLRKLCNSSNNRMLAMKRHTDKIDERTENLIRKTLSFSKKLVNHIGMIRYFICHYNQQRRACPL
jgi:hypothetical protein